MVDGPHLKVAKIKEATKGFVTLQRTAQMRLGASTGPFSVLGHYHSRYEVFAAGGPSVLICGLF